MVGGAAVTGPLSRSVAALCDGVRAGLTPESADRVEQIARRLTGPLHLAVAGRIKSGKSTVVNALIGRRVAPTDVRECTRLVTRFQYGTVDRVEVVLADGGRVTLPYDEAGLVPADLGVEPARISYVDAFLTSALLRSVTVIDTPGLGSLDTASARRTETLLAGVDAGSQAAVARAEAVLFVLTQDVRADEADALSAFHALSAPGTGNPVNAVAVLNKADQVVSGPAGDPDGGTDPMTAARGLADRAARALRHQVSDVLPLVGIVAEAAETGRFTEADAATLRQLAALDPEQRAVLFYSADLFLRPQVAVSVSARARLLERLDLYGVRRAVEMLLARPATTTGELRRQLGEACGFPRVRDLVAGTFGRGADGIKASVALTGLGAVAAAAPVPADRVLLNDAVESLLGQPEAHQLRLLDAVSRVSSGAVSLPPELAADLSRLAGSDDPASQLGAPGVQGAALRQLALDAAARWRSFATFGSSPAQSRLAHDVHRGFFLLWQRLGQQCSGGVS